MKRDYIAHRITYFATMFICFVGAVSMTVCLLDGLGITNVGLRRMLGV